MDEITHGSGAGVAESHRQVNSRGDLWSIRGTWWARKLPSICKPSTTSAPVHPFGERSTIIGHRGRVVLSPVRALGLDVVDGLDRVVEHGCHQVVHRLWSSPSTNRASDSANGCFDGGFSYR